jgi:hypothetical protein
VIAVGVLAFSLRTATATPVAGPVASPARMALDGAGWRWMALDGAMIVAIFGQGQPLGH